MNAFRSACRVEDESWEVLEPYLKTLAYDGRFVRTAKGPLSLELQKTVGDALFNSTREHVYCVEVKAEKKWTGNAFFERWSNRARFTPGWFETLMTDLLWYHFLDCDEVYEMRFAHLRRWMYWHEAPRGHPTCNQFVQAKQSKYDQMNDTWGYLVPFSVLSQAGLIRRMFKPEIVLRQSALAL